MRYARYRKLERAIADSDNGGIIERWHYGRKLIEDGDATTPAKNLRHGVLGGLIASARKEGVKLSEREIQYRLKAARAYESEAEIRKILADFPNWWQLIQAGFPAAQVTLDADTAPFDPRTPAERRQDMAKEIERRAREEGSGQLVLFEHFPADRFDSLATLAELRKYAVEMFEWTERQADADRRRLAYVDQLLAAVNGNERATWEQAAARLAAQDGGTA